MDPWNNACHTSYDYPARFLPSNIPGFSWAQINPKGPQQNRTQLLSIFDKTQGGILHDKTSPKPSPTSYRKQ